MRTRLWQLLTGVYVVILAAVGNAMPVRALNVAELIRDSDLIVIGTVVSVVERRSAVIAGKPAAGTVRVAQIAVDHVLKGSDEVLTLEGEFDPGLASRFDAIAASTYRLIFLKRHGKRFQFTNSYYPSLPAVPVQRAESGSITDRVAAAMSAFVESPSSMPDEKRQIIAQLAMVSTPVAKDALHRVLKSEDRTLRLSAASALLHQNDLTGLPFAEEALMRPDPSLPGGTTQALRYALTIGVKDPSAIPSLERLVQAPDAATRRAAASALRHTASAAASGALVKALDDSDSEVRYAAVIGLAEITGNHAGGPALDVFLKNPDPYVKYWKDWADRR